MSTFRNSILKSIVDTVNDNAIEITKGVCEANYLQQHQMILYMEGRMAAALRAAVPNIERFHITVDKHWDSHSIGNQIIQYSVSFGINDARYFHGVKVTANHGQIHDSAFIPKTTYSITDKSSWPEVEFERTVHELADEQFKFVLGDPKLSSSDLIELWEERILEALAKRYKRESFEASLTVSHGQKDITFTGTLEDVLEGYSVTVEVVGSCYESPKPPAEVIIGIEESGQDPFRANLVSKMSQIATHELITSFLAVEKRLPDETALEYIQRAIRDKLTEEMNDVNFKVSVGYYVPSDAVTVAIVEQNTNVTLSLVAKRK